MFTGETVTRLRYTTTTDRYGKPVRTGTPAELDIPGALFAPGGGASGVQLQEVVEPIDVTRTAVISTPVVYFPGQWPDITAADVLRVRGKDYEVIGEPGDWRSASGSALGGLTVPVKRVSG